jgi:hypothetical protein
VGVSCQSGGRHRRLSRSGVLSPHSSTERAALLRPVRETVGVTGWEVRRNGQTGEGRLRGRRDSSAGRRSTGPWVSWTAVALAVRMRTHSGVCGDQLPGRSSHGAIRARRSTGQVSPSSPLHAVSGSARRYTAALREFWTTSWATLTASSSQDQGVRRSGSKRSSGGSARLGLLAPQKSNSLARPAHVAATQCASHRSGDTRARSRHRAR